MLKAAWTTLLLLIALSTHRAAAQEYVREQTHINLRTGPGLEYRILKDLPTGTAVTRLEQQNGWLRVRTSEGMEGWVPSGYLSRDMPASASLPVVQAKLSEAETRIQELEQRLSTQTEAIAELDALRLRTTTLEKENARLGASSGWRWMATGAAILGLGALIGVALPRGGVGARNRLKF
jgi:SH3 domain protein